MHTRTIASLIVASAVAGAGIALAVVLLWPGGGTASAPANTQSSISTSVPAEGDTQSSAQPVVNSSCLDPADIYQMLRPAVVEVLVTSSGGSFGRSTSGEGSGIVIDTQGDILTNNHVAGGADTLQVKFADGTTSDAHLVGSDPGNDLAVIQVDGGAESVTPAVLADSTAVRVGDSVLAIGNPFELEATLTAGIVSATGRTYSEGNGTRPIQNMIQTDAPVNPGNSGGPLLDCHGQVVGVVTALENPSGQSVNVGVGFAVPSNTAERFLPAMLAGQTINHPWLGIAGVAVTPSLVDQVGLSVSSGVYVEIVSPNSPAERAGLQGAFASEEAAAQSSSEVAGGDVITAADGNPVASVQDLAAYIDGKKVGDNVDLTVVRDGKDMSVTATLADWPS